MLFRCGRRDLSNGVSLQAGDLASDTAHVVARGADPRLLVQAGIVLVRRRLVAGRGRFVWFDASMEDEVRRRNRIEAAGWRLLEAAPEDIDDLVAGAAAIVRRAA